MLKKRLLLSGVHGILVAVLAAGCTDDNGLTKEEYVAELNAMCESFSAQEKEIGEPQTVTDLVEKGPRILDAFEEAIVEKAHDLKAPDEIADQAEQLVVLADRQRDVLSELIGAAQNGDIAEVRQLASRNDALNTETDSIMRELGAEACVED